MQQGERTGTLAGRAATELVPTRLAEDGKVVAGKDGWLFLAGDTNDVLGQHAGRVRLGDDALERWRELLERRRSSLAEIGAAYFFAVAPDTHAVYPEKLPAGASSVDDRPITQLRRHLARAESPVQPIYLLEDLLRGKVKRPVCFHADSHWNEYGSYLAYDRLAREVTALRRVPEDDVVYLEMDFPGDLAHKLEPGRKDPSAVAYIRHASARLLSDNCVENEGTVIETLCPDAVGSCVLLADSYAWFLIKYLAETFRRFTLILTPNMDLDFIASREPDVVINLMAERYLIRVPDDLGGPTIADTVAAKRRAGRIRPAATHWDSPIQIISPATVERMRQRVLSKARPRDAAMISVLAYGALKPEELVALRWRDVAEDRLIVRKQGRPAPALWTRFPPLGRLGRRWRQRWNVDRTVPLMDHLAEDLVRWRSLQRPEPSDLVFPAADGTHWKRGEWRAWRDEVYVHLARECDHPSDSPYDLRHTFALLMINAGVTARKLAALLGSTRDRVLMDYGFHLAFLEHAPRITADAQIARVRTRREAPAADGDGHVDASQEASQRP